MNNGLLLLGYIGGTVSFIVGLPNTLRYYRPRKIDGRWQIEGVRTIVFSPGPGMSGEGSTNLLRAYKLRIHSPMLVGHEKSDAGIRLRFLVLVPAHRAKWAQYLLWRAGSEVEGYRGGERPAGMPAPWQGSEWESAVKNHSAPGQPSAGVKQQQGRGMAKRAGSLRDRIADWL